MTNANGDTAAKDVPEDDKQTQGKTDDAEQRLKQKLQEKQRLRRQGSSTMDTNRVPSEEAAKESSAKAVETQDSDSHKKNPCSQKPSRSHSSSPPAGRSDDTKAATSGNAPADSVTKAPPKGVDGAPGAGPSATPEKRKRRRRRRRGGASRRERDRARAQQFASSYGPGPGYQNQQGGGGGYPRDNGPRGGGPDNYNRSMPHGTYRGEQQPQMRGRGDPYRGPGRGGGYGGGSAYGRYDDRGPDHHHDGPRRGGGYGAGGSYGRQDDRGPGYDYDRDRDRYSRDAYGRFDERSRQRGRNTSRSRSVSRGRKRSRSHSRSRSRSSRSHSSRSSRSRSSSFSRSRSRSRSPSRDRSRVRDNRRDYDEKGRRERTHSKSRSRTRSRSRSRDSRKSRDRSEEGNRKPNSPRDANDDTHRRSSDREHSSSNKRHRTSSSRSPRRDRDDNRDKEDNSKNKEDEESPLSKKEDDALTKDNRTIFVSQLVMRAEERDIRRYFRKRARCRVNDVILLRDKRTGRHKGCAYVELGRVEDVAEAVKFNATVPDFQRFPILVRASDEGGEKSKTDVATSSGGETSGTTIAPSNESSAQGPSAKFIVGTDGMKESQKVQSVYVGSIERTVTQAQLFSVFTQFGDLTSVNLQIDTTTGISKGFAFLTYTDAKAANLAIRTMSGQKIAGRPLKTGWANQLSSSTTEMITSEEFPDDSAERIQKVHVGLIQLTGSGLMSVAPMLLPGTAAVGVPHPSMGMPFPGSVIAPGVPQAPGMMQPNPMVTANVTSVAEAAINAALGLPSDATPTPSVPVPTEQITERITVPVPVPKEPAGSPSQYLLVHNMFNKDEETDDDWEEDVRLDFEEECTKYGKIKKVIVEHEKPGGMIYVAFDAVPMAEACAAALQGRWFDKRQLQVDFVDEASFPVDENKSQPGQ